MTSDLHREARELLDGITDAQWTYSDVVGEDHNVTDGSGWDIACCTEGGARNPDEARANARFIAAAPRIVRELLAENAWPKTTPTGHTYTVPTTYAELRSRHVDAAQAEVECWEPAECPPEPTWEMVGIAHREVERLTERCANLRAAIAQREDATDELCKHADRLTEQVGALGRERDEARATLDRIRAIALRDTSPVVARATILAALDRKDTQ